MRGIRTNARYGTLAAALALAIAGCQSSGPKRVAAEPSLSGTIEPGSTVVEAKPAPSTTDTWVDRHPLFSKPRDYYESSGNNTIVKTAAATVIGIPAGIFGELKQIVVGTPSEPRF
jgi:hypothetical protein